jgi:alkylation response protein AidB-like acyl-CoA dehydrogenase
MNAERILIAAECLGDSQWLIGKARDYANERGCSAGRSARTRACSSRSPAPTPRPTPRA